MIVFVPDPVGGVDLNINIGCLCTLQRCRGATTLADIGLSTAASGALEISRYFLLIRATVHVLIS